MEKVKVVIIGGGLRGMGYAKQMMELEGKFEVVAVAEPIESRREYLKNLCNIPEEMCFDDYAPLFALGKIADVALICTQDRQHFEPAMKAIELKYDLLLEKPIAPTEEECQKITDYANEVGVNLKQGYNGDLTAKQAGSIGGQMVKKMIESYENSMK